MLASNPLCVGGQPMVALSEQFHHPGARPGLQGAGYGLQRSGESGESEKSVDSYNHQGSMITDQKRRTSNDLFIDHYSLVIERSACANEIIFCGYPDNNRVSTDIGTGLNDPECELYYVRNRTYSPVLGRWIQRDPIGYAGGINLYEYVGGRAVAAVSTEGLMCDADQVIYWTAAAGAATAADVYGADVLSALKEAGGAAVSDVLATLRGPRKSVRIHLLETIADALEKVKRGGSRGCRMLKSSNNNDVSNCADAVPSLRAARPPGAVNKPGVDCYSMACRTKNGGKK